MRRKNNGFITGELLSFGAILTFVVCYIAMDEGSSRWLLGAVLALIAYFNIRRLDDKNKDSFLRGISVYRLRVESADGLVSAVDRRKVKRTPPLVRRQRTAVDQLQKV